MRKYRTKSPFRAGVPEYWILMSSPWLAHTDNRASVRIESKFEVYMNVNEDKYIIQHIFVLTDLKTFIQIWMWTNSFFSSKDTKSSKLVFQHITSYHALPHFNIIKQEHDAINTHVPKLKIMKAITAAYCTHIFNSVQCEALLCYAITKEDWGVLKGERKLEIFFVHQRRHKAHAS